MGLDSPAIKARCHELTRD